MDQVDWRDAMWDIYLDAMDAEIQSEQMKRAAEKARNR